MNVDRTSQRRIHGARRLVATTLAVLALVFSSVLVAPTAQGNGPPPLALAPTADTTVWGANGRVMDIVSLGTKALIGGGFDYVGPTTGHAARTAIDTGALLGERQMVTGDVYTTIPDGVGGWYLGGEFSDVNELYRRSVAHVGADGSLDRNFNANVNGPVYALARVGGTLVIGGSFTQAGGASVTNLVAVDATGLAVPGWTGSTNNTVYSLLATGDRIYVGGQFTSLNGVGRRYLGRVYASTGATDTAFSGQTYALVRALALNQDGSWVYVGGDFTSVSSRLVSTTPRGRLAAFTTSFGDVQAWNPSANATVRALAVHPTTGVVHIGGAFTSIGGLTRTAFAAATTTGVVTSLNLGVTAAHCAHDVKSVYGLPALCPNDVYTTSITNGRLLVGGQFGQVLGQRRHHVAEIDLTTTTVTKWDPLPGNRVYSVLRLNDQIVIGGAFTSVGGLMRRGLALIDLVSGKADPAFQADVDRMVLDLVPTADGSAVYVAGDFRTVGGQARNKVAKVSVATGAVDSFKAGFNNTVIRLALAGNRLYAGGKFTNVGSIERLHVARLDATTGQLDTTWTANTWGPDGTLRQNGMVQGLEVAPNGSLVYLAGPFTTVNGASVAGGIAVVSGASGQLDPRRLGGVQGCSTVGPWMNRIHLSQDGQRLYGGDVCPDYIYKYDAVNLSTSARPTGLLWRTWCNAGLQGALEVNGRFYYGSHGGNKGSGGYCSAYPGGPNVEASRFIVFDATTGALLDYAPTFDQPMGVWSFAASPYGLLVGGDFTLAGDRRTIAQGFALIRGTP
ncbi:hypothetical protein ACOCJ7_14005 [Knoellia sp. CPCC 206453]|uniref:hypothetical protein n=1 Tax=Knoellia pratensis TaxID=3404796 RepID=UPI0036094C89